MVELKKVTLKLYSNVYPYIRKQSRSSKLKVFKIFNVYKKKPFALLSCKRDCLVTCLEFQWCHAYKNEDSKLVTNIFGDHPKVRTP